MPHPMTHPEPAQADTPVRYRKAAELIRSWIEEKSNYDERVWPMLKTELEDSAIRCQEPHEPSA